jgi:hypothetical protein
MIVTIHQPLFFPWLGYLDRMARADLFVVLDHVQFERSNYQNRARILLDGAPRWLTVPVLQRSQKERILDKEVDNRLDGSGGKAPWGVAHFNTLRYAYREAGFFRPYAAELKALLEARWTRLADLALASVEFVREAFGVRTPMVRSSELGVQGAKSELVLAICRATGARTFLGGMGGSRAYLDVPAFERAGIRVQWQQFRHPFYPQRGSAPFVPGLSSLDALFHCGPLAGGLLNEKSSEEVSA